MRFGCPPSWEGDKMSPIKKKPFIIGVAGGTASGKTSVCEMINQELGDHRFHLLILMNKNRDDETNLQVC